MSLTELRARILLSGSRISGLKHRSACLGFEVVFDSILDSVAKLINEDDLETGMLCKFLRTISE